ncbi:uncharacterized protein [Macaca fascicularis]|uniref:uncharacterized protein n=1 Tax=Macaca fascicularis TaxID=9541 RepID=UPI003D1558DB
MPGWGWLSRAGVPARGEVIRTLNHSLRVLPTGLQTRRSGSTSPTGAFPARPGLEKLRAGFPAQGRPTEHSVSGWIRRGPGYSSFANLGEHREGEGLVGAGRIPGAQDRTRPQEVPCVHRRGDTSCSGVNAWVGTGGLGLLPSCLQMEGSIRLPSPPRGMRPAQLPPQHRDKRSRARSSLVRTRHLPHTFLPILPLAPPPPHLPPQSPLGGPLPARALWGVRSLASPPLVPAGARGLGVQRSLLHRAVPALPGFLFSNITRKAPVESAWQNFLPDWVWAAVARDNPRRPGFLTPLGQASA